MLKKIALVFSLILILMNSLFCQNYYEQGLQKYYQAENSEAIELFSKSIENNNQVALSFMMRGATKTYLKQYAQAVDDISQSLKLDSSNYKAYFYFGRVYFLQGFYASALKYFDKAISINTKDPDVYNNRAICKIMSEDYAGAIKDEDIAISMDTSKNETFFIQRGFAKFKLNMLEEAIKDFDFSLKIVATQKAYANKGLALAQTGRHSEAIECYTKSLSIFSDDPTVLYFRGISYKKIKKNEAACIDFTKSKSLGDLLSENEIKEMCQK